MRNHRALPCASCVLTDSEVKKSIIYEYKVHLLIMKIGAVGGIEPPLGTLPPLGIYRVEQSVAL